MLHFREIAQRRLGDGNSQMQRLYSILFLAVSLAPTLHGQVGCAYPSVCTNPVPAVNITNTPGGNTWTDTYSETWTLTSTSGSVSGTVRVPMPAGCTAVTFTVSGSIAPSIQLDGSQGYTTFTWQTSNNPNPAGACGGVTPVSSTFSGTIQNDGNDLGPNTSWRNVTGESGTTTVTKSPSDLPISETTNAVGFSTGVNATLGQFRQILNAASGSTDIFKGRQVRETTGFGTKYDNCWFTGSLYPKWDKVQGSLWNVGYYGIYPPFVTSLNEWADDYIGWPTTIVDYYRKHRTGTPNICGARIPQAMYIGTSGTSGSSRNYSNGSVGEDIYTDHVTAIRNGVSQTAYYTSPQ